jgi:hypothetical protein
MWKLLVCTSLIYAGVVFYNVGQNLKKKLRESVFTPKFEEGYYRRQSNFAGNSAAIFLVLFLLE